MSYTGHTQARHYEVSTAHAASALRHMEVLRRQARETNSQEHEEPLKKEEKEPPKKRKRVNYTPEQEEELRKYFRTEIAHGKLPTRTVCEEFTCNHPWGRLKDQIYHKVKNLIKSA